MSTPFCSARVAKVCRRSWNRTFGNPARFSTRWSICRTLSGEDGASGWGREHIGAGAAFLSLLSQDFYCVCRQRQDPVCVFRLQRSFYNLTVNPADLPLNPEAALIQIDILPFQPQQFSSPETGGQFDVIHLKHSGFLGLPQEGGQLLYRQGFHFLVLKLRKSTTVRWIGCNKFLVLGEVHR